MRYSSTGRAGAPIMRTGGAEAGMNEIKCPQCGTVFQVDEAGYAAIARQVRDGEFAREIARQEKLLQAEKDSTLR